MLNDPETKQPLPSWICLLISLVLIPLLVFPCLFGLKVLADTLYGDGVILDHLLFVSKRDIWNLFWTDWRAALTPLYLLAGIVILSGAVIQRLLRWKACVIYSALAVTAGLVMAIMLRTHTGLVLFPVTGLVMGLACCWLLNRCSR